VIVIAKQEPKFWGSWKGSILKAIIIDGAKYWGDIRHITGLQPETLNIALSELFDKGIIQKNFDESYWVHPRIYKMYKKYFEESTKTIENSEKTKIVFVVHGRNREAKDALFSFLDSLGLYPLCLVDAIAKTGEGSPYIGDILETAFSEAQAVIVLMTPDDEARLREPYRETGDEIYEKQLTPQSRPNVLFEAGMAMGKSSKRTILIELGELRPFSDISGRHVVKLDNSIEKRKDLVQRLNSIGCPVSLSGTLWHQAGDFDNSIKNGKKISPTQDVKFMIQRFKEFVDKPVKSEWSIRILHPDKPIEKCIITFNGEPLPWWDNKKPYYEKTIEASSGGNVRVPSDFEDENAEIRIMDGTNILRATRFRDIVCVRA